MVGNNENQNESMMSDLSNISMTHGTNAGADMFNTTHEKYKGKPMKGYRICIFNFLMCLILTVIIIVDVKNGDTAAVPVTPPIDNNNNN
jgi:hypothetical protein